MALGATGHETTTERQNLAAFCGMEGVLHAYSHNTQGIVLSKEILAPS